MPEPPDFWEALFGPATGAPAGAWMNLRLVRKHGRPFLLLPRQRRAAALSLSLYPAQTPRARAARALLRWAVGGAIPLGTRPLRFAIAPEDDFVRFIASLAGEPKPALPTMGILAGNPAKDDQRFLILVFDAGQNPVAVVKAGLSERAQALVDAVSQGLITQEQADQMAARHAGGGMHSGRGGRMGLGGTCNCDCTGNTETETDN